MHLVSRFIILTLILILGMLPLSAQTGQIESNCTVSSVPASYRAAPYALDTFYQKFCLLDGVPVISSASVPDNALKQAYNTAESMLVANPGIAIIFVNNNIRIGVIGANEVVTDMPEYSDLPPDPWDQYRGLGATLFRPLVSGAEENILCYGPGNDPYDGESIWVHEFSHTYKDFGLNYLNTNFQTQLEAAYNNAINQGLWANTYAASNPEEYWAEGVQSYFNVNLSAGTPQSGNGIHNTINLRPELQSYDPVLYNLVDSVFGELEWTPHCPFASTDTDVVDSGGEDDVITPQDVNYVLNRLGLAGGVADVDDDGVVTFSDANDVAFVLGQIVTANPVGE